MTREEQVQAALAEMGIESYRIEGQESEGVRPQEPSSSHEADSSRSAQEATPNAEENEPLASAREGAEGAKAALAQAERKSGIGLSRDVPISAFVHLLGLATSTQVAVIENRLDIITNRLNAINHKLDRLNVLLEETQNQAILERLDYQVSDIKAILKKALPRVVTHIAEEQSAEPSAQATPKILTSDSEEDAKQILNTEKEFQREEAKRVRVEMSASRPKSS